MANADFLPLFPQFYPNPAATGLTLLLASVAYLKTEVTNEAHSDGLHGDAGCLL